eukprot:SAG11_NODE_14141_length_623_cov_1.664122_1_plen_164_part_00
MLNLSAYFTKKKSLPEQKPKQTNLQKLRQQPPPQPAPPTPSAKAADRTQRLLGATVTETSIEGDSSLTSLAPSAPGPSGAGIQRQAKVRLQCLDAVRGLNVMLMILVDNIGGWFQGWVDPSPWDVIHLADFVMPLFLFMVGVSMAFSMQKYSDAQLKWKVRIL